MVRFCSEEESAGAGAFGRLPVHGAIQAVRLGGWCTAGCTAG